jgi:hypothetical protein
MYQEFMTTGRVLVMQCSPSLLVIYPLGKYFLQERSCRRPLGSFLNVFRAYSSHRYSRTPIGSFSQRQNLQNRNFRTFGCFVLLYHCINHPGQSYIIFNTFIHHYHAKDQLEIGRNIVIWCTGCISTDKVPTSSWGHNLIIRRLKYIITIVSIMVIQR